MVNRIVLCYLASLMCISCLVSVPLCSNPFPEVIGSPFDFSIISSGASGIIKGRVRKGTAGVDTHRAAPLIIPSVKISWCSYV